jgi:isoquinoline 1-oxidoreductase beta subunit
MRKAVQRLVAAKRLSFRSASMFGDTSNMGQGFEMGMGWSNLPFQIPNHRAENGPAKAHVRIGWLRSVSNIYHAFAVHSFADELAALANRRSRRVPARTSRSRPQSRYRSKGPLAEKFPLDTVVCAE